MSKDRYSDPHERAAGGLDFDDPVRERASSFGSTLASGGPEALAQEIEKLIPESWRQHISQYPITAVLLGVGIGVFLGMKKGDQIIAAGSSLVAAAATANLNQFMARREEEKSEEES